MAKEKTTTVPSTQRYINIAEIKNGIIVTKTGELRKVIKVIPVNFALKSEEDQTVLIGQYQTFLNSLNFTLQILIHSRRLDVTPYLEMLKKNTQNTPNEMLRYHALEYIEFIRRLTEMTNIMDKQFYTVVGYDPPNLVKPGFFARLTGSGGSNQKISFSQANWKKYTDELGRRVDLVSNGLSAIGLNSRPLNTQETIELFYSVYNPEEATAEKLVEAESLEASIVTAKGDDKQDKSKETKKEIENILTGAPALNPIPNTAEPLNKDQTPAPAPTSTPTPTPTQSTATVQNQPPPSKEAGK